MATLTNINAPTTTGYRHPVTYRETEKHFADGFNFYKLFWIFTVGSVMGFIVETIWCLVSNGHFEVRSSFVFGPFTIIYGIGAVVLYLGLRKIDRSKVGRIFIFGMVGGTVVELIASWVQEIAFGTVSWDYSHLPLNINGRVCIIYTVFWGILAVLWVKKLLPTLEKVIAKIPNSIGKPLSLALLTILIILALLSIAAVSRWMTRIDGVAATGYIDAFCDRFFHNGFMESIYANMIIC